MAVSTDLPPPPIEDLPQNLLNAGNTDVCDAVVVLNDPPPPYPSRDRRSPRTPRSGRRLNIHHIQTSTSQHSQHHHQQYSSDEQHSPISPGPQTDEHDDVEATEATLLLAPPNFRRSAGGRPRSYSHASTMSAAPSLAQTVFSLFQTEDEPYPRDDHQERSYLSPQDEHQRPGESGGRETRSERSRGGFFSVAAWRRYFRPLARKAYYSSFLHLTLINFPYALAAWIYLFVFTVVSLPLSSIPLSLEYLISLQTGTTLLMALPLGAVLCFFNLLGARAFSRGELSIQYRFHYPLSYPPPYPPRPIFTRYREPTLSEIESGRASSRGFVRETSFYKNTYAMFTDSTSYQALFYFLVIKPAITLLLTIAIWVFAVPLMLFVLPAPAVLRAVRRLGIWQANVAVEGLYLAVR
ncbi:hypothetical protein AN958_08269 [Leucoagaricus sp. SymC.cos]|nr:hypothetical protein AN958_08269 [Leucoagaricus sp. SymC.cos]